MLARDFLYDYIFLLIYILTAFDSFMSFIKLYYQNFKNMISV